MDVFKKTFLVLFTIAFIGVMALVFFNMGSDLIRSTEFNAGIDKPNELKIFYSYEPSFYLYPMIWFFVVYIFSFFTSKDKLAYSKNIHLRLILVYFVTGLSLISLTVRALFDRNEISLSFFVLSFLIWATISVIFTILTPKFNKLTLLSPIVPFLISVLLIIYLPSEDTWGNVFTFVIALIFFGIFIFSYIFIFLNHLANKFIFKNLEKKWISIIFIIVTITLILIPFIVASFFT